jgi:hypothetical protein
LSSQGQAVTHVIGLLFHDRGLAGDNAVLSHHEPNLKPEDNQREQRKADGVPPIRLLVESVGAVFVGLCLTTYRLHDKRASVRAALTWSGLCLSWLGLLRLWVTLWFPGTWSWWL